MVLEQRAQPAQIRVVAAGPTMTAIAGCSRGRRCWSHLRRALTPRGTLVIVGGEGGGRWLGGTDRQIRALMLSPFVRHTLKTFVNSENGQDLAVLTDLIDSGKVTPVVDKTYSLAQTASAISYMAEGRAGGKVVITV